MVTLEWARGRLFDHEVGVSTTWSTTFAWVTWTWTGWVGVSTSLTLWVCLPLALVGWV
jgi:hypothetical protein